MKGLEPPRRKAQDPKSCASTNSATSAFISAANVSFFRITDNNITGVQTFDRGKLSLPVHRLQVH